MAERHLSIWLSGPGGPEALEAVEAPARPARLSIEFLDSRGRRVGRRASVAVPDPLPVEVPAERGRLDWARVTPPLSLAGREVADRAVSLRAFSDEAVFAEMPLEAAAAPAPAKPTARRVFNPRGKWTLLLVSEGFASADVFFAAAAGLDAFVRSQPPFVEAANSARFRIEALFWPSPKEGLFSTRVDGRLVFGDGELVKRFVKASGAKGRLIVVLVDKLVRGGAGGSKDRPAWVTTTSAPGEKWEAVALHELGHSFGLADEYADSSQTVPEPAKLEPNVTDQRSAAKAPWAALRTPGVPSDPTCDASVSPPSPLGVVGTFEGARYRSTGRYRPTAECLMQRTDRGFCPVCQAQIRKVLAKA
ncbi:MAG: hypothetical protein JOZ90_06605 [Alphaproteobacteria bacterium]|nr:hypothetical protein [Alphaproteobacteria bacterium]MBV9370078.1 hypothetical protein [Alphaproteobacteria bacterium]MBV9900752.1 hypothetical protein [Alphaproteobacteria bacterium]